MAARRRALLWTAALLVPGAAASQPGAATPVEAPLRELEWGELNFLHTTDTHGWLAGHLQEPQYSADWGDYVSFASHMRARAAANGQDLLLIDTGDRVEGNGLYDASDPKGRYTYDIFREQRIDVVSTGNHELYQADTAAREWERTVPNMRGSYLASNLDYWVAEKGEWAPMARRSRRFRTPVRNLDVAAFGFIFDFTGNANNTRVQRVEDTVHEPWFEAAVVGGDEGPPDLFVVVGHVGIRMAEFGVIHKAMRALDARTPIVFFGGHAHVRDAAVLDARAFALASGRYMETVGWLSVSGLGRATPSLSSSSANPPAPVAFSRRYVDNNLFGLRHHSGTNADTFPTAAGERVSAMIAAARRDLSLDARFGCAPRDLWMSRAPYPSDGSIYSWLEREVLPDVVVKAGRERVPRLALMNSGGIRFDIFKGAFTRDATYIVSPFVSTFLHIPDVPLAVANKVVQLLNSGGGILEQAARDRGLRIELLAVPEQMHFRESVVHADPAVVAAAADHSGGDGRQKPLAATTTGNKEEPVLIGGYTTRDDVSADGDDTVHAPLSFHVAPNVVAAEIAYPVDAPPATVDLAFIDFLRPWVVLAVKFAGGANLGDDDVKPYTEATLTHLMAEWIRENWKGDC